MASLELKLFLHQVAGKNLMLTYDGETICKSLNDRELRFYDNLPGDLHQFVPRFKGVVDVTWQEDENGLIHLLATASGSSAESTTSHPHGDGQSKPGERRRHRRDSVGGNSRRDTASAEPTANIPPNTYEMGRDSIRVRKSGSIDVSYNSELELTDDELRGIGRDALPAASAAVNSRPRRRHPWAVSRLAKLRKEIFIEGGKKFLLLENLVWQLRAPCVLDLKMGTRLHGDDETEAKRILKAERCVETTSPELGIRLGGMQVYRRSQDNYICHDKYWGRRLSAPQLRETLAQFFHDGTKLLRGQLYDVVARLRKLRDVLAMQPSYRFYSSSLLLLYDGKDPTSVDVRMIDFAHSTCSALHDDTLHSGPDSGYLRGLDTLLTVYESLLLLPVATTTEESGPTTPDFALMEAQALEQ